MSIITIDGPSGSGKGTICKLIAERLGYALLDSGAIYRLLALAASNKNIDVTDVSQLSDLALGLDIQFLGERVLLDSADVTLAIRQEHIGLAASKVAALPQVREALLARQRQFALAGNLVADGRDMGTTVFPNAQVKIFLTASSEERARRRVLQLEQKGVAADYQAVLADIVERDDRDLKRASSPLKPADDAEVVDCTDLSIDQVLAVILMRVDHQLES